MSFYCIKPCVVLSLQTIVFRNLCFPAKCTHFSATEMTRFADFGSLAIVEKACLVAHGKSLVFSTASIKSLL